MVPWQTPRDVGSLRSLGISILVRLKTLFHHTRWKSRRLRSVHDHWIVYVLYLYPSQCVDPLSGWFILPTIPVPTSVCDVVVLAHPTSRSLLVRYTPLRANRQEMYTRHRRGVYQDPSYPSFHFGIPTLHTFLFALVPTSGARFRPTYVNLPPRSSSLS